MTEFTDDLILKIVSVINDPVTTTDELIPSEKPLHIVLTWHLQNTPYPERIQNMWVAKEVQKVEKAEWQERM